MTALPSDIRARRARTGATYPPGCGQEEYVKLPEYDKDTAEQPPGVFMCHQDDERLCSGWVGTHDVPNLLSLRFAIGLDLMSDDTIDAVYSYESPVPLFDSGAEACEHGLKNLREPTRMPCKIVSKIERRRERRRE